MLRNIPAWLALFPTEHYPWHRKKLWKVSESRELSADWPAILEGITNKARKLSPSFGRTMHDIFLLCLALTCPETIIWWHARGYRRPLLSLSRLFPVLAFPPSAVAQISERTLKSRLLMEKDYLESIHEKALVDQSVTMWDGLMTSVAKDAVLHNTILEPQGLDVIWLVKQVKLRMTEQTVFWTTYKLWRFSYNLFY